MAVGSDIQGTPDLLREAVCLGSNKPPVARKASSCRLVLFSCYLFPFWLPSRKSASASSAASRAYGRSKLYNDKPWALDWVGGLHTSGCGAVVFLSDDNGKSWYSCGGVEKLEAGRINYDGRKFRTFCLTSVYDKEGKNWVKENKKVSLDLRLFQGYGVKAFSMKAFDVRGNGTEFQMLDPEKFLLKTNGYRVTGSLPVVDSAFMLRRPLVQFNSSADQLATAVMQYREQFTRLPAAQQVDCVFVPIDAGPKRRQDQSARVGAKRKQLATPSSSSAAVVRALPAPVPPSDRQGAFEDDECEGQEGEGGGEEGDDGDDGDADGEDNGMDNERDIGVKRIPCGPILYNHRSLSENIVRGIENAIESSITAEPGAWDRPKLVLAPVDPNVVVDGQGRRIMPDEFFQRDSAEFDWYAVRGQHTIEAMKRMVEKDSAAVKVYGLRAYSKVRVVFFDDHQTRGYFNVSAFDNTRENRAMMLSFQDVVRDMRQWWIDNDKIEAPKAKVSEKDADAVTHHKKWQNFLRACMGKACDKAFMKQALDNVYSKDWSNKLRGYMNLATSTVTVWPLVERFFSMFEEGKELIIAIFVETGDTSQDGHVSFDKSSDAGATYGSLLVTCAAMAGRSEMESESAVGMDVTGMSLHPPSCTSKGDAHCTTTPQGGAAGDDGDGGNAEGSQHSRNLEDMTTDDEDGAEGGKGSIQNVQDFKNQCQKEEGVEEEEAEVAKAEDAGGQGRLEEMAMQEGTTMMGGEDKQETRAMEDRDRQVYSNREEELKVENRAEECMAFALIKRPIENAEQGNRRESLTLGQGNGTAGPSELHRDQVMRDLDSRSTHLVPIKMRRNGEEGGAEPTREQEDGEGEVKFFFIGSPQGQGERGRNQGGRQRGGIRGKSKSWQNEDHSSTTLMLIYAPATLAGRISFFHDLPNIIPNVENLILAGDFNTVLEPGLDSLFPRPKKGDGILLEQIMLAYSLQDAFRQLHPEAQGLTWFSS
ncbi:hypothetical protein CBR_g455 [Chara braunii]|uniref:Endonuclease/exonuclease/phosphatase domain-containing protein n=1 Tax=Chara braunii TaxID=69332 RepID=A0A388KBD8_CHABU|nr:hypothetical protein CBR_g455 [Chara braunii]|eukprot:GBG67316.1 hypothetical protein CBR_g455 [Chara braunii]